MPEDISLIPQNRVENLSTNLSSKANDSDVVHKAGTETITGLKTFSRLMTIKDESSYPSLRLQNMNAEKGVYGGTAQYYALQCLDKNQNVLSWYGTQYPSSNSIYKDVKAYIKVYKASSSTDNSSAELSITYPESGNPYTSAPTPSEDTISSTQIDTVGARNTKIINEFNKNITNCITKIPQNINLELNNGTLILKAGSKVYIPNGSNTFTSYTITNDISAYSDAGRELLIFLSADKTSLEFFPCTICYSGSTAPTGSQYMMWYDTTNNVIKKTVDSGSTWTSGISLPIANFTECTSTKPAYINQTFNGFGYMGSCVFVLPDIEFLSSDGRNTDGTYKNINITTDNVIVSNVTSAWGSQHFYISLEYNYNTRKITQWVYQPSYRYTTNYALQTGDSDVYTTTYDEMKNIIYFTDDRGANWTRRNIFYTNGFYFDGTRVTKMIQSYVGSNLLNKDAHIVSTWLNGTDWCRIWSDGWIEQGGVWNHSTGTMYKTLLKAFSNTNYTVIGSFGSSYAASNNNNFVLYAYSTTQICLQDNNSGNMNWYACGY